MITRLANRLLEPCGLRLQSRSHLEAIEARGTADIREDGAFMEAWSTCAPFTVTSIERGYGLWQAILQIVREDVPGDIVECGVFRGGSSMLGALALQHVGATDRRLWLYDTYAGMSAPTDLDVDIHGRSVAENMRLHGVQHVGELTCAGLEEVRTNVHSTGYPADRIEYVAGKVEDTIPGHCPDRIALLRLDTDWYESTIHELVHLFPRLDARGFMIVDDYGHWRGARKAVDEYFATRDIPIHLQRLDYTGRIARKAA